MVTLHGGASSGCDHCGTPQSCWKTSHCEQRTISPPTSTVHCRSVGQPRKLQPLLDSLHWPVSQVVVVEVAGAVVVGALGSVEVPVLLLVVVLGSVVDAVVALVVPGSGLGPQARAVAQVRVAINKLEVVPGNNELRCFMGCLEWIDRRKTALHHGGGRRSRRALRTRVGLGYLDRFGLDTLGAMMIAITREPSPSLGRCELSFLAPQAIDVALAVAQHRSYVAALVAAGCEVVTLPAEPELPDAVFVEDPALVVDELAILTRPGALSRRAEVASIGEALAPYRALTRLLAPATLDGGDVLRIGRTLYVGRTARTNDAAIEQLRGLLGPFGYAIEAVAVTGCLHLKSAVTALSDGVVLANPALVDVGRFAGVRIIEVDPGEPHAANALRVGARLIYPSCYPRTRARLAEFDVIEVDASEVIKAEGAVTCCSLVFTVDPARVEIRGALG